MFAVSFPFADTYISPLPINWIFLAVAVSYLNFLKQCAYVISYPSGDALSYPYVFVGDFPVHIPTLAGLQRRDEV